MGRGGKGCRVCSTGKEEPQACPTPVFGTEEGLIVTDRWALSLSIIQSREVPEHVGLIMYQTAGAPRVALQEGRAMKNTHRSALMSCDCFSGPISWQKATPDGAYRTRAVGASQGLLGLIKGNRAWPAGRRGADGCLFCEESSTSASSNSSVPWGAFGVFWTWQDLSKYYVRNWRCPWIECTFCALDLFPSNSCWLLPPTLAQSWPDPLAWSS